MNVRVIPPIFSHRILFDRSKSDRREGNRCVCVQLGQKGEKFLLDSLVMMMLFYYLVQRLLPGPFAVEKILIKYRTERQSNIFLGNAGNRWIFPPLCYEFMFCVPV